MTAEGGACPGLLRASYAAAAALGGCSVGRKPSDPTEELLKMEALRAPLKAQGTRNRRDGGPWNLSLHGDDSHPSDIQVQVGLDRWFSTMGGSASPPAISGDVSWSSQLWYPGNFQTQASFKQNRYKKYKVKKSLPKDGYLVS